MIGLQVHTGAQNTAIFCSMVWTWKNQLDSPAGWSAGAVQWPVASWAGVNRVVVDPDFSPNLVANWGRGVLVGVEEAMTGPVAGSRRMFAALIYARVIDGLTYDEIASMLGVSASSRPDEALTSAAFTSIIGPRHFSRKGSHMNELVEVLDASRRQRNATWSATRCLMPRFTPPARQRRLVRCQMSERVRPARRLKSSRSTNGRHLEVAVERGRRRLADAGRRLRGLGQPSPRHSIAGTGPAHVAAFRRLTARNVTDDIAG